VSDPRALDGLAGCLERWGDCRRDEPMARHTTFGIGGPADLYLKVAGIPELHGAAMAARRAGVPLFVLGSGSNILVGDGGIRGLVIENNAREFNVVAGTDEVLLRVASGASFASTSRRLCREGYWGLEWAVGIPGTLGGAVVYNAGAYGGCLADVLASIDVVEPDGGRSTIPASELELEYRGSTFTRGLLHERVILAVELRLRRGDPAQIMAHVGELDRKRLATQPRGRNAGSIFKNPPEHPAWWLIDQAGLRGVSQGDAEISQKHANFFSNTGKASAADVFRLMQLAKLRVQERFGVELHAEVALVGEGF